MVEYMGTVFKGLITLNQRRTESMSKKGREKFMISRYFPVRKFQGDKQGNV